MIKPLLEGRRVLVCRPEPSATELATVLESVGAKVKRLPCIEIQRSEVSGEQKQHIYDLDQYEKVVVVSQFSAQAIAEEVDALWPQHPTNQTWFGIGRKTSQCLEEAGFKTYNPNADLSSEALLSEPKLKQVKGEKILLVKGHGGRSKLEQGLRDRGAKVHTIELYKRVKPSYSEAILNDAINDFQADSIITLSAETLDNFHGFAKSVSTTPKHAVLVVPSSRVAKHATSLGYLNVRVAEQLKPINLIKCLARQNR